MAEYSSELDKITYAELALSLQNTIKNNLAHTKRSSYSCNIRR